MTGMPIRVLWLCMQPSPRCAIKLGHGPYSWIGNLSAALALKDSINLAIVGPSGEANDSHIVDGVRYYGITAPSKKGRLGNAWTSWHCDIEMIGWKKTVEQVISEFSPHVIHVHGTENPFGLITTSSKVPVVISLQGLLDEYRRYVFAGLSFREKISLFTSKAFVLGRGQVHGYLRHLKMARRELEIFRKGKYFIGRTSWDRSVLELENRYAAYYHCDEIMRAPFYTASWNENKTDIHTIYTTSSSMLFKGVEVLLEAFSLLKRAGYAHLQLRIAGVPSSGEWHDFLRHRERMLGLDRLGGVQWLGRIAPEDIVKEILGAGTYVYPSHIDNSPNALCEALLLGAPCVASAVGGIPTLVSHERTGLLYDDKDPYALASQIKRMLDRRDEAVVFGAAARKTAMQRHDPIAIADCILEIYRTVASGQQYD